MTERYVAQADKAVQTIRHMFLMLAEAREIADESWRKVDPAQYLRNRVRRLIAGDRFRGHSIWLT